MTSDPCAVAHGAAESPASTRTLVAVFASPVAGYLLRYGLDLGYRPLLFDPDPARLAAPEFAGLARTSEPPDTDAHTDVVATDHHRDELGTALRDVLAGRPRWIGVLGHPRHEGPHVRLLTDLGVSEVDIGRVHRPIGLNIGSRTPAEIAVATLAGLIADRNDRPGGFTF